jgi:ABC-2 type transport system permease protein
VQRLAPFAVLLALFAAGVLVPAFSLVEERERRTLEALLVGPTAVAEILWAKGLLGAVLSGALAAATLLLNGWGNVSWALVVALALAASAAALLGLIYGVIAPDAAALFALFKTFNVILFAPVLFYVFPDWPRAIAYAFPTYWIIDGIVAIAERGASLVDVAPSLLLTLVTCVVAAVALRQLARRSLVSARPRS